MLKNKRPTEPEGTKSRISRCTDPQVLPVSPTSYTQNLSFSVCNTTIMQKAFNGELNNGK